ncbi:probable sugar phosphate/phosphate translocator At1g06470 isoform X2 [Macadamia integrifolia]|uniref:probable sugar phosphate/phosphate translocator At1g06470 isoform X2 n=1 Tax=Macadamia integrifolia TaxID=60698 RepID=UPI001C4EFE06|nr:probable sugar phosphate/phosphate translocator At1g06470 isoform X2 [Macadamia integrifolia]
MQKEMVENNLETEKCAFVGDSDIQGGNQGLRREPSFSGDGSEGGCLGGERQKFSKSKLRSMHINGGHSLDNTSYHIEGNGNERNYVPFDVENGSGSQPHGSASQGTHKTVSDTQSPISVVVVLKTLFFIVVWYSFSTCLTLYNKTLLGDDLGKFPAPMLMNTVHFGMQAFLSNAITWFWAKRFRPRVAMSWRDYFMRVVPTALGTALDINLSNASLVFISVTFATMCKSASPIFLLLFAFGFRLETPSIKLFGIMLLISFGILLTVARETEFELWGFIFVMLAAVMSGFRWCMTQILLQREAYGLKDPLTLMSYVTPVMAVSTALLSLVMDPWDEFKKNNYFNSSWHVLRSTLLMIFGGTLAFFMVLTEYILVSVTSAVTVNIAGVVKEAVTILVAVFYFHDQFTWLKGIGLITIMVGVSLFNWFKIFVFDQGKRVWRLIQATPCGVKSRRVLQVSSSYCFSIILQLYFQGSATAQQNRYFIFQICPKHHPFLYNRLLESVVVLVLCWGYNFDRSFFYTPGRLDPSWVWF